MEPSAHLRESPRVIHVIDDDSGIREALSLALTIAGYPVRVHESARAFLAVLEPRESGCVITDIRMPDMNGLDLLATMNERKLSLPAIVITAHGDVPLAVEAMKQGAIDFLEKPFDNSVVVAVVSRALLQSHDKAAQEAEKQLNEARLSMLMPRERHVLACLLKGQQNKIIAGELGIGVRSVETHRAHVMAKMQARNIRELMRMTLYLQ